MPPRRPQPAETGTLTRDGALEGGEVEVLAFELAPEPNLGAGQASGVLGLVEPSDELRGHSQLGSEIRDEAGIPPLAATRNGPKFSENAPEGICSGVVECQTVCTVWWKPSREGQYLWKWKRLPPTVLIAQSRRRGEWSEAAEARQRRR